MWGSAWPTLSFACKSLAPIIAFIGFRGWRGRGLGRSGLPDNSPGLLLDSSVSDQHRLRYQYPPELVEPHRQSEQQSGLSPAFPGAPGEVMLLTIRVQARSAPNEQYTAPGLVADTYIAHMAPDPIPQYPNVPVGNGARASRATSTANNFSGASGAGPHVFRTFDTRCGWEGVQSGERCVGWSFGPFWFNRDGVSQFLFFFLISTSTALCTPAQQVLRGLPTCKPLTSATFIHHKPHPRICTLPMSSMGPQASGPEHHPLATAAPCQLGRFAELSGLGGSLGSNRGKGARQILKF